MKYHFWRKKRYNVVHMYATLLWTSLRFPKIDKPLVGYRFYCMGLFHSQTRRHMIKDCMFVNIEEKGVNGIDNARHSLFVKVKRDIEELPPTHYILELHIKRPNYQAKICKGE